jgi:hypothetical protein
MTFNINEALVKAVELSSGHMSQADSELLNRLATQYEGPGNPIVLKHAHGHVIVIGEPTVEGIKAEGASAELSFILESALKTGDIMYVAFDGAGTVFEELPQFEW